MRYKFKTGQGYLAVSSFTPSGAAVRQSVGRLAPSVSLPGFESYDVSPGLVA